jgi:hypothetical protein
MRRIRSTVEQCHGRLKNHFKCLLKHRTLHYSPETTGRIVNACAVLHNICVDNDVPLYEDDFVIDEDANNVNNNNDQHLADDNLHNNM